MLRKSSLVLLLIPLLLAACGGQTTSAPENTATPPPNTSIPSATPQPSPTAAPTSTATIPPTQTPVPEPSLTAPPPTNAPDCTNQAAFVADVTIPDNTTIQPGLVFTKTWRVRNTGTCAWGPEYTLDYYSQDPLGFTAPISLPLTLPGSTADLSLRLQAPEEPGAYQGNFVIKNPDGLIMAVDQDSRLWVLINVSAGAEGLATPTATPAPTETPQAEATGAPSATAAPTQQQGSSGSTVTPACAATDDLAKAAAMLAALNTYRADNNLPPLPVNDKLSQAAQRHAYDMACNRMFYHDGSDGSTPASRVADAGYQAVRVSENVYGSYPPLSGQEVVTWWATDPVDPLHNQNLLTTQYPEIGIGYAFFDNYGYYVIVFARP